MSDADPGRGSEAIESAIRARLAAVRERIAAAACSAGRDPASVRLLGVSKRKSSWEVVAALRAGLEDVAENYVQEAAWKVLEVEQRLAGASPPRWHYVGHLQRNKARDAIRLFDWIHSVDSARLAAELDKRATSTGRRIPVLIQVNLSGEEQKGGVAPKELGELVDRLGELGALELRGLMALPARTADPEAARPAFARLRELRDALQQRSRDAELRELSMGMSEDFEVAIQEGATMVRIGTAIFGPREA